MQELQQCCGIALAGYKLPGLMFADDIVLFGNRPEELQIALNKLEAYCSKWKLTVNKEKTKLLVFGSSPSRDVLLKYRGTILEQVKSFKYLGVTLSYNGSFSRAVEDVCHCSLKVLYIHNEFNVHQSW